MIENCLVEKFKCLDNNADTLELIESICFNTLLLDLRAVNDDFVTHVLIDEKTALKLSKALLKWAKREVTL